MKIIFISIILSMMLSFVSYAQGSTVYLSTRDSLAYDEHDPTDLMGVAVDVSGTYTWYKATWFSLSKAFRIYVSGQANTWSEDQHFSGGIYSDGITYADVIYPQGIAPVSRIGYFGIPFNYVYANQFVVVNEANNDSLVISFNDSTLSFSSDKTIDIANLNVSSELSVSDKFNIPSDSTGLASGSLYFRPSDGIIRRKY